jgi:ubiquinone/menaquinone biosynthesis C-methylase UbiE
MNNTLLEDQSRWDQYGRERITEIHQDPNRFIVENPPYRIHHEILSLLGSVEGKEVLELGCGHGDFSVWLAKQGAKLTGVDIGPSLIDSAQLLAEINHVACRFQRANVIELRLEANTYDIVIGVGILHHFSASNARKVLRETYRVLKSGGVAVFFEPVENSRIFNLIQNVFPAGRRGEPHHRPSILRRQLYQGYVKTLDDRDMTNHELISLGEEFSAVKLNPFGLVIRLERLVGRKYRNALIAMDGFLFRFPRLHHFSQTVLVEYHK